MEKKHTPGPWKAYLSERGWGHDITANHDCFTVAHVHDDFNANLIAAAPELLAVVKAFVLCADAESWNDSALEIVASSARAAISKAKGE